MSSFLPPSFLRVYFNIMLLDNNGKVPTNDTCCGYKHG